MANYTISERAKNLTSSAIREILKVTEKQEIISFAGGLPSPHGFPVDELKYAFNKVLSEEGKIALQYGTTEGYSKLREWIVNHFNNSGSNISIDNVMIVSGSQQALDLLGKTLIDENSDILVESPTYLGALQSLSLYNPNFITIETDEGGLIPERISSSITNNTRFLYALPNFQNPTGRTLSLSRRIKLIEFASDLKLSIIEDDPYGELRYSGKDIPSLLTLSKNTNANIIRLGSFSKILAPGLRIGYIIADKDLIKKLVQAKQATDLHTSTITQMVVYETIKNGFLKRHLPKIRETYKKQGLCMLDTMEKSFPKSVNWTRPEGGMFLWVTLPKNINSNELLIKAIENNIAFVPGNSFYAKNPEYNNMRLSFATVSEEKIQKGINILGNIIKNYLNI
ncbi:2-aminoadipate transaminase [Candidatus Kinetoplastibacterium sorsogonicusi]|uniref:2-aminoadipate transaminase n=1 Tax=Candidatus Kinetoplastidibacterium kentomonadis TaxID=1576550 RepID=A0A3S7JAR6_9PROT|nr:PLP-dependent aminotransferase family protein [Candidatus Kinetoplastibacterium sorsogonicusi]AWD32760.1 2-aminoadipate transaminase [Candidatus Kinetoplastibacterium sorsogonicusi]